MERKLDNRIAIVTGGGMGLGFSYAKALAENGAKVMIAEINEEVGKKAEKELIDLGYEATYVHCDVGDSDSITNAVNKTVETYGTVNILINNAQGLLPAKPILEVGFKDMDVVWKTGPMATLQFMQECFPHMKESGYGRIINVCSDTGVDGMATFAALASAKEAIRALTRVAAREFGPYQIPVNVVSPGALTPASKEWMEYDPEGYKKTMEPVPMQRLGDPDIDIAPGIVFLASEDGRFMTGQTLFLDGGHTFGR